MEQWQPKNIPVTFRMYQLNFGGNDGRVYDTYWNKYENHFVEKEVQRITCCAAIKQGRCLSDCLLHHILYKEAGSFWVGFFAFCDTINHRFYQIPFPYVGYIPQTKSKKRFFSFLLFSRSPCGHDCFPRFLAKQATHRPTREEETTMKLDISYLLKNLTLEEKAGLCSGANFWWTKAIDRLGLPSVMVSDGPHGLRKQVGGGDNLGLNESVKAVCFPTGAALACSFDRALAARVGEHIGEAAQAENVHTVLGPAVNMKRSPLCGRNFEYLSEDPYLAGELAARYVGGVQSQNVGVSVKHYAADNQEYRRMSTDTIVSERALREIYLAAFEKCVKQAKPWTIMCAYNRINGTYCCENEWLLTKVLRKEWGFDGIVMTDWGAMNDRVKALQAGLNLEMPSSYGYNDRKLVAAVENGALSMEALDALVEELLCWIDKGLTERSAEGYDKEAHHRFARQAAAECAILLKNQDGLLPLSREAKVAFIGSFAAAPRFQGGGSSHIRSFKITNAVDAAKDIPGVCYAPGWRDDGVTADAQLLEDAVQLARRAEVAVVFAGLPDSFESEGYDRKHLDMPDCQNDAIAAVCAVQPHTVVVLHKGSPVLMPWADQVAAIIDMYLGGQAVGEAAVDLLFGDAEPTGRLAETFPARLEDTPAYLNFPGTGDRVVYAEDVFIGYRWYDSRVINVLFPFGYGLSYTRFAISNLTLSSGTYRKGAAMTVSVDVTNAGNRPGKHVVQLYVAPPANARQVRPVHELKGFEKVALQPGETKTLDFTLDDRSFAYYEESMQDWHVESGAYTIQVGSSSRDLPLRALVQVKGKTLPFVFTDFTTVDDVIASGKSEVLGMIMEQVAKAFGGGMGDPNEDAETTRAMVRAMMGGMPLHSLASFARLPDGFVEEIKSKLDSVD